MKKRSKTRKKASGSRGKFKDYVVADMSLAGFGRREIELAEEKE